MSPDEVRQRAPAYFAPMYEGARRADERRCQRLAWVMANLMNSAGGMEKPVKVWDLLEGLIGSERATAMRREQITARWRARRGPVDG